MAEDRAKKWEAEINNTIKNHKNECVRMEDAFRVKEQALDHYTKEKTHEFESFRYDVAKEMHIRELIQGKGARDAGELKKELVMAKQIINSPRLLNK